MKALLNWRFYVLLALFAAGMLGLLVAAGEPVEPMSEARLCVQTLASLGVTAISFFILSKLIRKWEAEDKIPELTIEIE